MRAVRWLIDTAGSITGTRFRLVVASSSTATALIIGSSLASGGDSGLASQLAQALASLGGGSSTPASTTPASTASRRRGVEGRGRGHTGLLRAGELTDCGAHLEDQDSEDDHAEGGPRQARVRDHPEQPRLRQRFRGAVARCPIWRTRLRPQGELLSNYTLLTDKGLPNYIGMIGGQSPNALTSSNCTTLHRLSRGTPSPTATGNVAGDGCIYPTQAINLADQLFSSRFNWGAIHGGHGQAGAGRPGGDRSGQPTPELRPPGRERGRPTQDVRKADPSTGYAGSGYAVRHNPFAYFHSLLDLGSCTQKDVPLDRLDGALASGTPNFTFISPNLCDTGEPTECDTDVKDPGPAQADKFLSTWVPRSMASPAYQRTAHCSSPSARRPPAVNGAPVGTLLLSKFLTPGSTNTGAFNPYSIFRTVEDLFGLQHIAAAANTGTTSFASDLLGSQKKKHKKK